MVEPNWNYLFVFKLHVVFLWAIEVKIITCLINILQRPHLAWSSTFSPPRWWCGQRLASSAGKTTSIWPVWGTQQRVSSSPKCLGGRKSGWASSETLGFGPTVTTLHSDTGMNSQGPSLIRLQLVWPCWKARLDTGLSFPVPSVCLLSAKVRKLFIDMYRGLSDFMT